MNFNSKPSREGTFAYKWEKYKGTDVLPMWIADTEFRCAPAIVNALHERVEQGLFGYTLPNHHKPAIDAVVRWCNKQYGWQVNPDWIVWTPGVVPAFNMACKAFCETGDTVLIQTPNYPPLLAAPELNGLKKELVGTVKVNDRYTLDFEELARKAAHPKCKLFIICNPMNPVGSVLSQAELDKIASICRENDVLLCSDEIHCDLILDNSKHLPASAHPDLKENSVTLMAASKTFNIAGLGTSFAIVPNAKLRAKLIRAGAGMTPWVTVTGLAATQAAFTLCDDWYDAQINYLRANRDYLVKEINTIEGLSAFTPQATFLLWIEAKGLGDVDTLRWCEEKRVGPSPGRDFNDARCFRINFGCSRLYLEEAINRLRSN